MKNRSQTVVVAILCNKELEISGKDRGSTQSRSNAENSNKKVAEMERITIQIDPKLLKEIGKICEELNTTVTDFARVAYKIWCPGHFALV